MSDHLVELDERWVRRAFLIVDKDFSQLDHRNTMWSDAVLKFTDTTIGGSMAINPPPQFTKYCDIPSPSRTKESRGISRYYSEAIDDNSQIVHFRMGEARFNTLASFYSAAYNPEAALAASSSRMKKTFFELGRAVGFVVSVMSFKLLMVRAAAEGYRLMAGMPKSKYYYHTPTMHAYWGAVTTMVNQLAVNRGIIPRVGGDNQAFLNGDYKFTPDAIQRMHNMVPDVFREDGGIDVYAMANKAKRLYRKRIQALDELINSNDASVDIGAIIKRFEDENPKIIDTGADFHSYLNKWYQTDQGSTGSDALGRDTPKEIETGEGMFSGFNKLLEYFKAEADDGGMFASFRVNYTGSMSESFSNSAGESEVQSKLNSLTNSSREVNFSLANGNIAPIVGEAVDAAKGFISGALTSIGVGGLAAIGGAAFFDIPKVWESSSASLPRNNYTIKLNSPYGNPISQLFNIYIPLCMLLAMALPKSTGKQSYSSPFLIEYYDQGRGQSRLGLIDSMSITRGTSSLGFTSEGKPLAIDVSFSIMDLSSIMHMPITMGINPLKSFFDAATGGLAGGLAGGAIAGVGGAVVGAAAGATLKMALDSGFFDDDTIYSDYLAVLAGMSVNDQIYTLRKLKLNLTRKLTNWKSWASISNLASFTGDLPVPGRLFSIFYKGVNF